MSEIDKILRMLAEHYGHDEDGREVIRDLASKRQRFEKGGTPLEDFKNIKPIEPNYGNEIFVTGDRYGGIGNDPGFIDLINSLRDNSYNYSDVARTYDPNTFPDEIVVTATTTPPPSYSLSVPFTTLPPPTEPPEPTFSDEIIVTATTAPPSYSLSVPLTSLPPASTEPPEPTFSDEIVVTATTAPPSFSLSIPFTTLPPASTEPPVMTPRPTRTPSPTISVSLSPEPSLSASDFDRVVATTAPPRTVNPSVSIASTPALTWNPAMFPSYAPGQMPAEYRPLQQFNLPNYANVYDVLFQGQGAGSQLGQSMLVPPDQQPNRLDVAMAAAQQAQQQAPQQPAPQSKTGTGKARGGSVNDTIDGIIAYLQSIRR